jgi:cysteine synthase A
VGNTPLLRIDSLSRLTGCEILGKAEFMNPGGSIKDRAAKGMIERAEAEGRLRPGSTIVEGTAGNTGIGLGLLGVERGYRVVVTMPDNQAREKYELLEAMGVEVRRVPPPRGGIAHRDLPLRPRQPVRLEGPQPRVPGQQVAGPRAHSP